MSIVSEPEKFMDSYAGSPPVWWNAIDEDGRYYFWNEGQPFGGSRTTTTQVINESDIPKGTTINMVVGISEAPTVGNILFKYNVGAGDQTVNLGNVVTEQTIPVVIPADADRLQFWMENNSGRMYSGTGYVMDGADPVPPEPEFNCECSVDPAGATLASLRSRMMVRLGFAAMKDNPPPGMLDLIDAWINDAQRFLFFKYPALRTRRMFRWTMTPGQRFYGLRANDEDLDCAKVLNPYRRLSWVGIQGPNNEWTPLVDGISPGMYVSLPNVGRPSRFEITTCIEVFPPPDYAYKLWIKGIAEYAPMVDGDDITSLDPDLVFLWALAYGKAHYQQVDKQEIVSQGASMLREMIAGTHGAKRYIPGEDMVPNRTRPGMRDGFLDAFGNPEA